eukprot:sb/3479038/
MMSATRVSCLPTVSLQYRASPISLLPRPSIPTLSGKSKHMLLCGEHQEPTETSKQPIRTCYLGHVIGYQPIRDQYFHTNRYLLALSVQPKHMVILW